MGDNFMPTKSILLAVTDPQMLVDITQSLGAEWETASVASGADVLAQFEKRSFDALLVDFNLGSPDASELLNQALEKHPSTNRFLLAHEADLALVAAKVNGSPHILPKPVEPASLKSRIENGVKDSDPKPSGSETANTPSEPPKIPAVYAEVLKALELPEVTNGQVGEIISHNEALTSEVLKLANTSFLGLPRNLTRPTEAVEALGLETVKAVVMALQFLTEHSQLKLGYLALDQIWQHSRKVGQIARDLVLLETKDRTLASQALAAGLLHDLGKVVLAKNFEDLYGRVHSLARKQPVPLWEIEKEMFGANHGEIGGCLVGMWNMPMAIVEAAAFHHEPPLGEHEQLTPLAAVHIANVLERELGPGEEDMRVAPILSTPFLNELGLLQRVPVWRAALGNKRIDNLQPEAASSETDQSRLTVRLSTGRARRENGTATAQPGRYRMGWVWAGAAAILVLLTLWFRTQREVNEIKLAYARTPTQQAPGDVSAKVSPQTVPVAAPQVTPGVAVSQEPTAPAPSQTVANSQVSQLATEPVAATAASKTTVTNVQPPSVPPKKKAQPEFRLSGIIYAGLNPSAIVNGRTVSLGDQVDGATVVGIERTTVTLKINGQRRTYELW